MSEKEFTAISQLIYHKFGIYLPSHNRSFLTNRLAKLWSDSGHSSWSDYFHYFSQTVLPEMTSRLSAEGHNDLRIWCAALVVLGCSPFDGITGGRFYSV